MNEIQRFTDGNRHLSFLVEYSLQKFKKWHISKAVVVRNFLKRNIFILNVLNNL